MFIGSSFLGFNFLYLFFCILFYFLSNFYIFYPYTNFHPYRYLFFFVFFRFEEESKENWRLGAGFWEWVIGFSRNLVHLESTTTFIAKLWGALDCLYCIILLDLKVELLLDSAIWFKAFLVPVWRIANASLYWRKSGECLGWTGNWRLCTISEKRNSACLTLLRQWLYSILFWYSRNLKTYYNIINPFFFILSIFVLLEMLR